MCAKKHNYGRCCSAVNCSIRTGTNLLSAVKMFNFPYDPDRRRLWEIALDRKDWKAPEKAVLCSNHFISKKPSNDPQHPDYVPSIFSHKRPRPAVSKCAISRYNRSKKRAKISDPDDMDYEDTLSANDIAMAEDNSIKDVPAVDNSDKNAELKKRVEALEARCQFLERCLRQSEADEILQSPVKFEFYTKLPNVTFFNSLLGTITYGWQPTTKTGLELSHQLLMVLMKLRLGLVHQDLAVRFKIGCGTASTVFREWICRMATVLRKIIPEPSRRMLRNHMPQCFIDAKLEKATCIIDCSDIFIEKPYNLDARAQTFSNYKNGNTAKFLMGISPVGCVTFISQLYGGRISDKEIIELSNFMDTVKEGDVILADRGFRIQNEVNAKSAQVFTPAFTKGKAQLSALEVVTSRALSRVRVHIERCIGHVKKYRILKSTWPLTMLHKIDGTLCLGDQVLIVLCALCNLKATIVN